MGHSALRDLVIQRGGGGRSGGYMLKGKYDFMVRP